VARRVAAERNGYIVVWDSRRRDTADPRAMVRHCISPDWLGQASSRDPRGGGSGALSLPVAEYLRNAVTRYAAVQVPEARAMLDTGMTVDLTFTAVDAYPEVFGPLPPVGVSLAGAMASRTGPGPVACID
jgi:hypothetical protein